MFRMIDDIRVWGDPLDNAVDQMKNCFQHKQAAMCALMADHHLGYAVPIGGVLAYKDAVSPSGVGYDIACGNKAVRLDCDAAGVMAAIKPIMDQIVAQVSFGMGRINEKPVDNELFDDDPAWDIDAVADLKDLARSQLGTVGSGNHYVDIFIDQDDQVWIGVHFGSRGFGHKIATHFLKAGGAKDGMNVDPLVLPADSQLGQEYIAAMNLAGRYAYAGRDWVCQRVADIIGASIVEEVHNHHNFAWKEEHMGDEFWVIRKGATPAFPGQRGFIGASMGEDAVLVEGVRSIESRAALYSTVHGAGRVMSRTQARGKVKWRRPEGGGPKRPQVVSKGEVSQEMMDDWVKGAGVELRGGGTDESPHCYKRLPDVLAHHADTIKITHTLRPIGVAMAGGDVHDPYKD